MHAKGCPIFVQRSHPRCSSNTDRMKGATPVSTSVNPAYWEDQGNLASTLSGWQLVFPHRAPEVSKISDIVGDFRAAAVRAKRLA
ncbi:MAG: NADH:flavin oxidoreductase [Bradyrhizobium sp.]|nr:NADH:flavin oxidoreductase [Bradyrhizobium sp.]